MAMATTMARSWQMKKIGRVQRRNPLEMEGLLQSVLLSLPFRKILVVRSVCKLWNSILGSSTFWKAWSARHESCSCCPPWLVMVRKPPGVSVFERELIAFDPSLSTWMSLETLLPSRCPEVALEALGGPSCPLVVNYAYLDGVPSFVGFTAAGCQGGLACFVCAPRLPSYFVMDPDTIDDTAYPKEAFEWDAYYFLVINPLTGSHTILPQHPRCFPCYFMISMQTLPHHHYRIFMTTHHTLYPGDLEIFDSCTESWREGRSCWEDSDAKIGGTKELERADFLFFTMCSGKIFCYNIELDEWSQMKASLPYKWPKIWLGHESGITYIRHKGRLLVAQALFNTQATLTGFGVWELRPNTNPLHDHIEVSDWVQVAQTPRRFWDGFNGAEQNEDCPIQVKIVSSGSLICMTAVQYFNPSFEGHHFVPVLYDLDRNSWQQLPPYKGHYDFSAVFGMQPSLVAVAQQGSK
ncbi:hypothetical protein L7F22_057007 [Adiantum nelumboides]|nr:hypothetical protein [Adiantum nelumboides]